VQDVRRLGFTADEQRQIFFDNARELLDGPRAAEPQRANVPSSRP
jgi:hypothetical protein